MFVVLLETLIFQGISHFIEYDVSFLYNSITSQTEIIDVWCLRKTRLSKMLFLGHVTVQPIYKEYHIVCITNFKRVVYLKDNPLLAEWHAQCVMKIVDLCRILDTEVPPMVLLTCTSYVPPSDARSDFEKI